MHTTVQVLIHSNEPGKLSLLSEIGAVGDSDNKGLPKELRLHVYNKTTNQKFLIDSGSVVSIIRASYLKHKPEKNALTLYAANSSQINTYGIKTLNLDLNLRRNFSWSFVLADIKIAIIGADFLTNFNLLVDLKNKRLIDTLTNLFTRGQYLYADTYNVSTLSTNLPSPYRELLEQYIEITKPISKPNTTNMKYAHRIITKGPPVTARARKLAGEKAVAAKVLISEMLNNGTIRPSSSTYASPMHLTKKKKQRMEIMRGLQTIKCRYRT